MHPDGNREIRAMAMVALPIPPLPMLACRELEEEHSFVSSDHTVASSHDMIAHLMNVACAVTSTEINSERQAKQTRIGDELFASVDEWQSQNPAAEVPPVDWCYEQATKFTRGYIASYLPHKKEEEVDARFLPAHDIDPSHRIHRMALEFQRAQDVIFGSCSSPQSSLQSMTYAELVQHSFRRILLAAPK